MLTIENSGKLVKHFILYEDRMLTVTQIAEQPDQYVIKLRSDTKDETAHWQFNGKKALTIQRQEYGAGKPTTYQWAYGGVSYLIPKDMLNDIGEMLQHFMKCILHSSIEFTIYDPTGNAIKKI